MDECQPVAVALALDEMAAELCLCAPGRLYISGAVPRHRWVTRVLRLLGQPRMLAV